MATSATPATTTEIPSSCSDASRPGKLAVWIDFSLMNACARFPPSLHALKVGGGGWGWGWGGGKQLNRSANTRNRGRLKDNNGKLWVEVIIVTFQMQ